MARDPIRGEGMLIAVGIVLLGSVGAAVLYGLRAIQNAPPAAATTAPAATSVVTTAPPPPLATPESPSIETPSIETPPERSPGLKRHGAGGSSARAPSVRFGALTVSGRLPAAVVQRIVRQNFGRFRMCYERALANAPELRGRISARFVIGRDGGVSNVSNGGSDLPNSTMVACVLAGFYGLSFPVPEGGIVTAVVPIDFSPS